MLSFEIEGFDVNNILIDEKAHKNILFCSISYIKV